MTQQSVFEKLMARGEEVWDRVSTELMSNPQFVKALQGALKGKEMVDQAVGRALKTMNLPTRTEFKRAVQRIEKLEQEVATLRAAGAKAPRAPRTRAAKPSARGAGSRSSGSD